VVESAHRGPVCWMDLEGVEHRFLISCAADTTIAIYDMAMSHKPIGPIATISKQHPGAHQSLVSCVCWYPIDTGIFLSGGHDEKLIVWDSNMLACASTFPISSSINCAAMSHISRSHTLISVGTKDQDVVLCDIVSGGFTHRLQGHHGPVWSTSWSYKSEWELLTGGRDGKIRLWDIRRAELPLVLDMNATTSTAKRASDPSATRLARSHWQGRSHDGGITGLTATPDGLFWLSAGNDDRVRLWSTEASHSHCHQLVHYSGAYNRANKPRQIAVSGDGFALYHPSGSSVQIFEVATGRLIKLLSGGHFDSINACVWNEVYEELYTGSNDQTIVAWQVDGGYHAWDSDGSDKDAWSDDD
jgi:DNA excision repair protein ERCC-8